MCGPPLSLVVTFRPRLSRRESECHLSRWSVVARNPQRVYGGEVSAGLFVGFSPAKFAELCLDLRQNDPLDYPVPSK